MIMTKEKLTEKKKLDMLIAEALKAIYTSEYFNNFQKEAVLSVIAQALKEHNPAFSIDRFKEFVKGK